MDKIIAILKEHSCLTAKQISTRIFRWTGEKMTPQFIGANLRKLILQGKAGCSNCGNGSVVYWLVD